MVATKDKPTTTRRPSAALPFAAAAAVYTVLAFVAMLPGAARIFRQPLLWFEGSDMYHRIWWFRQVFAGEREDLWHLADVLPPWGVPLMMTSNGVGKELLFAVGAWGLDPTVAGNLLMVSTPVTVALAGYLVLRKVLRTAFLPALVGGWLCGWSGFGTEHLVHPWLASVEGLVIFLGALLLLRREVTQVRVLAAGMAAAMAAWFSIQSIVYLLVLSAVYTVDRLARRDWRGLAALLSAGGIAILLCLPLLWETWKTYGGDLSVMGGETPLDAMFLWRGNLAQLVLPAESAWPLGGLSALVAEHTPHRPAQEGYLGWIVIPLALVGVLTRHRGTGFLASVAIVGLLLSFGPVISLYHEPTETAPLWGATWIAGPFYWLRELPVLNSQRTPARFIVLTNISMGLLAGFGLLRILRWRIFREAAPHRRPWERGALVLVLLVLHTADRAVWPLEAAPRLHSPFHAEIAREEGEFAILDIPYGRGMTSHMYLSIYHEKQAIWGYGARMPMDRIRQTEEDFHFAMIASGWPDTWPTDHDRFAASLVLHNVRYIILHERHLNYNEVIQGMREQLIALIEDPATWEDQPYIEPPRLAHADDTIRAYLIVPRVELPE